jgi:hypothetical protein
MSTNEEVTADTAAPPVPSNEEAAPSNPTTTEEALKPPPVAKLEESKEDDCKPMETEDQKAEVVSAEPRKDASPTAEKTAPAEPKPTEKPVKEEGERAEPPAAAQLDATPEVEKKEDEQPSEAVAEIEQKHAPKVEEQLSQGAEPGRVVEKSDDAMETEDQDTSQAEQAEESSASKELPYSTRGRSTEKDSGSGGESRERGAFEALEEIGRAKESTPASMGVSFLEALSEEERRTRTRFLPDVDGMHVLRKNQIKDDLNLARSLVSAAGMTSLKKKGKRSDAMDVDDEEGVSPSEDSDVARLGTSTIKFAARNLVVPSNAFVTPPGTSATSSNEDGSDGRESQSATLALLKSQNGVQSPSTVESVTAFNPPRPAESIGAKKKHRMLRWERRPEDVEVDLNNYRKTVQRTRQELHNAEAEHGRLESIDAHLRWHFLNHLNLMNKEYLRLNQELGDVQQDCVKVADLLTSRTRSRGAGKGTYVMRDVLAVLQTRGAEPKDYMETESPKTPIITNPVLALGLGGLPPSAFSDWNRKSTIIPTKPASAWIVPGDKVKTPYGEGVVVDVHPAENFSVKAKSKEGVRDKQNGDEDKAGDAQKSKKKKDGSKSDAKKVAEKPEQTEKGSSLLSTLLPSRISVRLPFGTGHFLIDVVKQMDNPALFSDAKLVERWKNMMKTAMSVGGCIDIKGMSSTLERPTEIEDSDEVGKEDNAKMDVYETLGDPKAPGSADTAGSVKDADDDETERTLPFGAGLLPTSTGRGNLVHNISITEIEKEMQHVLYSGSGVLGEVRLPRFLSGLLLMSLTPCLLVELHQTSNQGVTEEFRSWEDDEQEHLTLQASVLQTRNALVRQKRIRLLNERTSIATTERYNRAEDLVAEMRSDLKSLKHRLEEELKELGKYEYNGSQESI